MAWGWSAKSRPDWKGDPPGRWSRAWVVDRHLRTLGCAAKKLWIIGPRDQREGLGVAPDPSWRRKLSIQSGASPWRLADEPRRTATG